MKKFIPLHTIFISLLVCLLAGCAGIQDSAEKKYTTASIEANKYFKLADAAQGTEIAEYRLQGIEQLILANNYEDAEHILFTATDNDLTTNQNAYKKILQAQIALQKRDSSSAQKYLRTIWTPHQLPENLQIKFFLTRSEAFLRGGNFVQAIQERIYMTKNLHNSQQLQENNQAIWSAFEQLTPTTLRALHNSTKDKELNAWIEFATIMKQYDSSPDQKLRALQVWRKQHPNHAAGAFLPTEVLEAAKPLQRPHKIALLLPLQGKNAESAKAVRDGFLAAYYAHKNAADRPKIQVYDTTESNNLSRLYQRAVEEGANFVVGPLTKDEVESISMAAKGKAPILALNTTDKRPQDNFFNFSLSPEHEAEAVAIKARQAGHRRALIIIPNSKWGARMHTAFANAWQANGGEIVAITEISTQTNINEATKQLLSIDRSETRAAALKQMGMKIGFEPRRRQDVDIIFIATNGALARQVKPLLNFYYAGNIPTYATSSIYAGKPQAKLDQDLNGIRFCDMPWVLDSSISSRSTYKSVANLWPDKFEQYARLYALGLDSYKVAMQLDELTLIPDLGLSGMTGMLTVNDRQQIQRRLMWAQFKKGIAVIDGQ